MEIVAQFLVVAIIGVVIWLALQPRYVFLIRIRDGVPAVEKGTVSAVFLSKLGEACAEFDVVHGWVGGLGRGRDVALDFSTNVPPLCQQRLRNLWLIHR
jgi:hypothetical protein